MTTIKWNKKKDILALMVGHGLQLNNVWDTGCTYGKYNEAALMLRIVRYATQILRRCGVRVITDADQKNNRNMKASVAWADKVGARRYISVHCDYKLASAGVAPLYRDKTEKEMAATIAKVVAKRMGMKYKGVFRRTNLYELNAPKCPSTIFECGAIKADLKYLKAYKKYGRALALGILKYIDVPYISAKAKKIADKAKELSYKGSPDEARYPSGKPTKEYKEALNKAYPNRKSWRKACRLGASCDVGAGTIIRASGVDKRFPRGLNSQVQYLEESDIFTRIKDATSSTLRDGDIIIYARKKEKGKITGHICIFAGGKIKHAALERWYLRTTDNEKTIMSKKGKLWVRVYRAC